LRVDGRLERLDHLRFRLGRRQFPRNVVRIGRGEILDAERHLRVVLNRAGIGRRLGDAGETAYLELVKTTEQKETERKDRIASAEAREKALKGGEKKKAKKGEDKAEEGAEEKPKRGGRRREEGGPMAPAKKRTRTGVKTG
jgi:hypothetical protein